MTNIENSVFRRLSCFRQSFRVALDLKTQLKLVRVQFFEQFPYTSVKKFVGN